MKYFWPKEDIHIADELLSLVPNLRDEFLALGISPRDLIHQCGSGVTACHNLFAMEYAGLKGSQLYAGSWSEWCQYPDNPVALGPE